MTEGWIPWGRDYCPFCGHHSEHNILPGSEIRNKKGRVIAIVMQCGWTGCRKEREEMF